MICSYTISNLVYYHPSEEYIVSLSTAAFPGLNFCVRQAYTYNDICKIYVSKTIAACTVLYSYCVIYLESLTVSCTYFQNL